MATRPSSFLAWCPDDSPAKIQQPSDALRAQGYVENQSPTFDNFNWLLRHVDLWLNYLDSVGSINSAQASQASNMRMVSDAPMSWDAIAGTWAWNDSMLLAIAGVPDANNAVAAGSVVLTDGQLAYVTANIPFVTSGDFTSGSASILNLVETAGISVGQNIQAASAASGAIVTGITGSTVSMSANATSTLAGEYVTFSSIGSLSVWVSDTASFQPGPGDIVIARRVGDRLFVGVNAVQSVFRSGESKRLGEDGVTKYITATAGVAIAAHQALYLSGGTDGRTAGRAYLCDATDGKRANFIGLANAAATIGNPVGIMADGYVFGFGSYAAGAVVYVDPASPGNGTTTIPTATGQYIVPIGTCLDASTLYLASTGIGAARVILSTSPWPQYGVTSETELAAAFANCASAGGGVIVINTGFAIAATQTLPASTTLVGRSASAPVTLSGASASISAADYSRIKGVSFVNTDGLPATIVSASGVGVIIEECTFLPLSTSATVCIGLNGSFGTSVRNVFQGVVGATATGIKFNGPECSDEDSVFTSS